MARRRRRKQLLSVPFVGLITIAVFLVGIPNAHAASQIPLSGTGAPITGDAPASGIGDVTQVEFAGQSDEDADADIYPGIINDQSLSNGSGNGVSVNSGQKAKSTAQFNTGFEGLNHYQQRYARSGNQFSLEPPDQGLCVGNGYEVE